jgi:monoamine oxidase
VKKTKLEINQKSWPDNFDDVVLAVPPSAWTKISKWLPGGLAQLVGAPPQMGKNIKMLLAFRWRFWKKSKLAPSSTENGPVDQTWETTESYSEPQFGMVAFSGADHAAELSQLDDKNALKRVEAKREHPPGTERISLTKDCGRKDGDRGGLAEWEQTKWKERKRRCALTSTGLLMEGLGKLIRDGLADHVGFTSSRWGLSASALQTSSAQR